MTKIKLCGLKRACEMEWVNTLKPDYIGFVFAKQSRRYVTPGEAEKLKKMLCTSIKVVGVFVNEEPREIVKLAKRNIVDVVQLHGNEDEDYIKQLKGLINLPIIQAFQVKVKEDVWKAEKSSADMILLDSGAGGGETFAWKLLQDIKRPYFLAGGLTPENVVAAIESLSPLGVDVSSALETEGVKEKQKMKVFVETVRRGGYL